MAENQLAIINKELQDNFSFHGETVTFHPVSVSAYSGESDLVLEKFPLSDDPSVECFASITYSGLLRHFVIKFIKYVPGMYEYEISLYCVQKPYKLLLLGTKEMGKIVQSRICKFYLAELTIEIDKNRMNESYLFCTKISRKDVPYIFQKRLPTLHASQITDCSLLFEKNTLTNFKIVVEDRYFWVHKEILAAKSPVFLALFESEMKEKKENQMIIEDLNSKVFEEMLRYIYTNDVKEVETHAEELLKAADKYDIPKLKLLCGEELSRSVEVENSIHLLALADQCHESNLKDRTMKFIQSNIEKILKTEEYKTWRQNAPAYLMADILEAVSDFNKKYSGVTYCT